MSAATSGTVVGVAVVVGAGSCASEGVGVEVPEERETTRLGGIVSEVLEKLWVEVG